MTGRYILMSSNTDKEKTALGSIENVLKKFG